MSIRLTPTGTLPAGLDFRGFLGEGWTTLTADALRGLDIGAGDARAPLGDFFAATGSPDGVLVIDGDLARAGSVCAGLSQGTVEVLGSVGDDAGSGMTGGALVVRGDAGSGLGGAPPGQKRGMSGGEIVVHGSTGENAGYGMRRGLIAVGTGTGRFAGFSMIAGTIVCLGRFGSDAGLFNKRGSLVALGPLAVPLTYRTACHYAPGWLRLTLTRLRDVFALPVSAAHLDGTYSRLSGDFAELGKGEILAWNAP